MRKITFLVCGNGFGHFIRCARISKKILEIQKNVIINFICEKEILSKQSNWFVTNELLSNDRFNFINSGKTIEIILKPDSSQEVLVNDLDWINKDLILNSDIVISDNITSILQIRSDVILMGSFLWAEVIKDDLGLVDYYNTELNLLKKNKPKMIALQDMAMPYVRKYTNPFYTSWITDKKNKILLKSEIKNILVMGGGTGLMDGKLINAISKLLISRKYSVFSTKSIISRIHNKSNINEFDFLETSFINIDLIICRPGIGSLTDCVKYNIPVLGIGEKENNEIQFNLKRIETLNFGYDISDKINDIVNLIQDIENNGLYKLFQKNLKKTKKDGINEISTYLINKIKKINEK